jgi:hypothetical protein
MVGSVIGVPDITTGVGVTGLLVVPIPTFPDVDAVVLVSVFEEFTPVQAVTISRKHIDRIKIFFLDNMFNSFHVPETYEGTNQSLAINFRNLAFHCPY